MYLRRSGWLCILTTVVLTGWAAEWGLPALVLRWPTLRDLCAEGRLHLTARRAGALMQTLPADVTVVGTSVSGVDGEHTLASALEAELTPGLRVVNHSRNGQSSGTSSPAS